MRVIYHLIVTLNVLLLTVLIGEDIYSHLGYTLSKPISYLFGFILANVIESIKLVLIAESNK